MQGMSERQYAAHVGLSRGAIQKAKTAERLVLFADGSSGLSCGDRMEWDPSRLSWYTTPAQLALPSEKKHKPSCAP
jgi:hypothetical protein